MAQPTIPGTGVGRPQMPYGSDGSDWIALLVDALGRLQVSVDFLAHASDHEDGGDDEIDVTALSGLLADDQHVLDAEVLLVAAALAHKGTHVSAGSDPFLSTDLLAAVVRRLQVTGPVTLLLGAVADGEYLKRDGTDIIGGVVAEAGGLGEGHITILPDSYVSIGQGNWDITAEAGAYTGFFMLNATPVDLDNISYQVFLDAGTYTLLVVAKTGANHGILDVDIDAGEIASFDLYSNPAVQNVRFVDTGNVIGTPGLKTLKLRVHGQHGSSTGYYAPFIYVALWRTA